MNRRLSPITLEAAPVDRTPFSVPTMRRSLGRDLAVAIAAAALAIAVIAPVLHRGYSSLRARQLAIGVVDIAELVREEDERVGASLAGATSPERARELTEKRAVRFAQVLDQAIRELPEHCRCTVVNAAAILAGHAIDLTPHVRTRLRP